MKKPLTETVEIYIYDKHPQRLVGPKRKLRIIKTFLEELDFKPMVGKKEEDGQPIPWREAFKKEIEATGEPALMLRGARHKEGLSQSALAEKLGIPQYNLSKMENGRRPIGKEMARRLAKVLNINYRVFL